ncbi:MAG TPA: hypothetical protein VGQ89_16570 [Candidatus Limnocylindrales bacterium]|nr:hypothetical protein [Candidatus Limnocylindrales bacterium]
MTRRRPSSIAQPGITAWGRAAERELEAYLRRTALASPVDFTDRVMAAIEAESPSRRNWWIPLMPALVPGRLRMTGGLVVVLIAMLGGAALVGGASAIIGRDLGAPAGQAPDEEPILVVEPTATATEGAETPTAERPDSTEPPAPPEPNQRDAVEATVAPDLDGSTHEPAASGETDETDEPDGTHDGDDEDGADDQEETDEPEGDDSSGGFGEDAGGGLPEEPGGSSPS